MKITLLIFFLVIFTQSLYAQKANVNEYANLDKKALALPDSLTTTTRNIAAYIRMVLLFPNGISN